MVHWFYGSVLRVAGYDVDFGCLWRHGCLHRACGDYRWLTHTGAAASGLTWDSTNVMCFTAGTLLRTVEGLVLAEEITQGTLVWTKDDGYQPIR